MKTASYLSSKVEAKPILFGISGIKISPEEESFLRENPVLGFILFRRNIETSEQLRALTSSLKELYPTRAVPIFIDQEGGSIARLKPPIAKKLYDSATSFGKLYDESPDEAIKSVTKNYREIMDELVSFNITSPCAPVADLRIEGAHSVIGDRSFGESVEKVVALAKAAIKAIAEQGGIPVIKHIPGHGRAKVDSHFELPRVDASLEELDSQDFEVFRQLSGIHEKCAAMTAHIVFDAIDPKKPLTISKKGIDFIRNSIGFKGLLLTDAVEMLALHGKVGALYTAVKSALKSIDSAGSAPSEEILLLETEGIIEPGIATEDLKSTLESKKKALHEDFIKSLVSVSQQALDAGADIILHCTGDFNEMKAIGESIKDTSLLL